jgi:transglutaminase-like putative cysteine protease/thiol-disulfide isomerase/thioredoxin
MNPKRFASVLHLARPTWSRVPASAGLLALLLTSVIQAPAQVPNPGSEGKVPLQWLKDYSEALKRAEAEKKPVLIDFTTDWCGWSKKMDRETFADSAVQKELRTFVLIRVNPEASDKNEKISESFGVEGYPTLVVANFRGEEIATGGFMDGKEMLEFLRRYLPLFKSNPLGYKPFQLDPADPLMKAIQKIPPPASRPTTVGSFVVLDQSAVVVQTNGAAKMVSRTATFIADPEKGLLPRASGYYVSSREKLRFKAVRIVNVKGAGREMELKLAKDEHAYSNQNVYWDARLLSLEVPTLKEGDILDVIEEREIQPIMPDEYFFQWATAPQIYLTSDLTITFPSSLNLQKHSVRCATPVTETKNPDGTLTWQLRTSNTRPFEPVVFSPPLADFRQGYDFYTPCSKDMIAAWFTGLCKGRDELPTVARQRVATLKRASNNQTALLRALAGWVTKDIRYVSVAFGAASHQPHPVADTLANLYGDCKDQSLLVQALCREAGIPAHLVLVDALGLGFEDQRPAIECFNHCIVEAVADGKTYYVDATAGPTLPLGQVPQAYAGSRALEIEGATGRVVTLPPYEPLLDQELSSTLVKLNPNGSATVSETAQFFGQKAVEMKEQMKRVNPEKARKSIEASYKGSGRKLLDFYMTDTNSVGDRYETRLVYTLPRFGSQASGGLAFRLGDPLDTERLLGALTQPRTEPFWFHASDGSKTTFTVELPAGAVLKGRPDDLQIDTPFIKAARKIEYAGNKLSATETSRMLEARLAPSENGNVHDAFRRLTEHREFSYVVQMPLVVVSASEPAPQHATGPREVPAAGAAGPLRLSGISGNPPRRLAIINGKTLAEGESAALNVDGRRLTVHCLAISDRAAAVSIDGVTGTMQLELKD